MTSVKGSHRHGREECLRRSCRLMEWIETRLNGLAEGQRLAIKARGWETDTIDFTVGR